MAEVVTLTLNPCIDKTFWVSEFGQTPDKTEVQTGGKGVNVSRVLVNLGVNCVSVAPVGGDTGRVFMSLAKSEGINLCPVMTDKPTRVIDTYVRKRDCAQKVEYRQGESYSEIEIDDMETALFSALTDAKVLAICGSSCESGAKRLPVIIRRAKDMGVKVILDSNGAALKCGVAGQPDVVKPNQEELKFMTGIDDISKSAEKLMEMGAKTVLASMGEVGCMYKTEESEEYCPAPRVKTVNPVGSGDSFTAAFIYASLIGMDIKECLAFSCAAGAANAAMFPAARITLSDIKKIWGM